MKKIKWATKKGVVLLYAILMFILLALSALVCVVFQMPWWIANFGVFIIALDFIVAYRKV